MKDSPLPLPLVLDGGTGTHLLAAGMSKDVCAEQWVLENPDILTALQKSYAAAGSKAVFAPTFGANRARLAAFGLEDRVAELNRALVKLTRDAVGEEVLVGGDLSPTGLLIPPYGDAQFDDIVDIYREQITALTDAGVDFIVFETMMSLWECRAGLIAAHNCGVPVFVCITVDDAGRTPSGSSLPVCVTVLQEMGAAAVGINCSESPDKLAEQFYRAAVCARIPLIAKPGAGLPDPDEDTPYPLTAESFAGYMSELVKAGASIIGGCCGTGPEHIAAIAPLARKYRHVAEPVECCANETSIFFLPEERSGLDMSETIACSYSLDDDLIDLEDSRANVAVIRVDSDDDAEILSETAHISRLPIAILCDDAAVLEHALRLFHGRAIVDSRSELEEDQLASIAARYGALVY